MEFGNLERVDGEEGFKKEVIGNLGNILLKFCWTLLGKRGFNSYLNHLLGFLSMLTHKRALI